MADITLQATIHYQTDQPYKIELTRGQKGAYGWTITVHGATAEMAINELDFIDRELRAKYAAPVPETREE